MIIRTFKISKKFLIIFIILCVTLTSIFVYSFATSSIEDSEDSKTSTKNEFIKWVDFSVTSTALEQTAKLDIDSHTQNAEIKYNWIELLSYLACKNGGNFKNYKKTDLDSLIKQLENGQTMEDLTSNLKFYD